MQEHPNATIIRNAMEGMDRGDMEAGMGHLAEDVVWHEIGRDEPTRGRLALEERLGGGGDYEITARLHDVVANDDHAIALVEATGTRGGKTLTYRTAEIMHIRDGKITERWAFSDDTAAIAEFFG